MYQEDIRLGNTSFVLLAHVDDYSLAKNNEKLKRQA